MARIEHYRPSSSRRDVWRRTVRWVALIITVSFTLGAIATGVVGIMGGGRESLALEMMEDYGRRLQPGESRDRIEYNLGVGHPNPKFPGWHAAYDLGVDGVSFRPRRDWLLLRYENGVLVERTIAKEPRT